MGISLGVGRLSKRCVCAIEYAFPFSLWKKHFSRSSLLALNHELLNMSIACHLIVPSLVLLWSKKSEIRWARGAMSQTFISYPWSLWVWNRLCIGACRNVVLWIILIVLAGHHPGFCNLSNHIAHLYIDGFWRKFFRFKLEMLKISYKMSSIMVPQYINSKTLQMI